MNIAEIYNEYSSLNNILVAFVEDLSNKEFYVDSEEETSNMLKSFKSKFEGLFEECNGLEVNEEDYNNLQDLKYLLFDALLFTRDMVNFYELKEFMRIKMRITNYIAKKRRSEIFGGATV